MSLVRPGLLLNGHKTEESKVASIIILKLDRLNSTSYFAYRLYISFRHQVGVSFALPVHLLQTFVSVRNWFAGGVGVFQQTAKYS